jgi:hypothetical protein
VRTQTDSSRKQTCPNLTLCFAIFSFVVVRCPHGVPDVYQQLEKAQKTQVGEAGAFGQPRREAPRSEVDPEGGQPGDSGTHDRFRVQSEFVVQRARE